MPKARRKTTTFEPGYYCPVCELLVPTPEKGRHPIWHEECKPHPRDPARLQRICPGCGRRRTLPFTNVVGSPSAFCNDSCKERYKAHMTEKHPHTPKCRTCERPFDRTRSTRKNAKRCNYCHAEHLGRPITTTDLIEDNRLA